MFKRPEELTTYKHGMAPTYWKYSWGQLPYGVKTLPRSDDLHHLPERWVFVERRIWQKFIGGISHLDNKQVLDLGCGAGKLIQFFLENGVREENITALDENSQLIKWCSNAWTNSALICTDATKMDHHPQLIQRKFDLITAHMLFNLLDDNELSTVLENAYKKLNHEGVLAFQIPSIEGKILSYPKLTHNQDKTQLLHEQTPWGKTPYFHRSKTIIKKLIDKAGFIIERSTDYSYGSFDQNDVHLTTTLGVSRNALKRLFLVCRK